MVRVPTIPFMPLPVWRMLFMCYVVYVFRHGKGFVSTSVVWFGFGFYSSRRLSHLLVLALLLSDTAPLYALPTSVSQQTVAP